MESFLMRESGWSSTGPNFAKSTRGQGRSSSPTPAPGPRAAPPRTAYWTFTSIGRGFTSAFFGSTTESTPFFDSARIFSASTVPGTMKERWKAP